MKNRLKNEMKYKYTYINNAQKTFYYFFNCYALFGTPDLYRNNWEWA